MPVPPQVSRETDQGLTPYLGTEFRLHLRMETSNSMTIGELARKVGVGVETIRFYQRKGLLDEPLSRPSGYRQFGLEMARRLRFIRRTKELGFSLAEIRELLELRAGPRAACEGVRDQLEAKIVDIQSKILDLQHMKRALREFSRTCEAQDPLGECPILEALEHTVEGSA